MRFGLALAAFVIASWAVRFVGHGTLPALDAVLYFLPLYAETYGRLAAGTLPLWNPYQLCGIPWIATLQGGFFYPGHVLYLVLPLHVAFALSNVLHLVVIAVATAAFTRRLGLGGAAAVLAAVVFTLRGRVPAVLFAPNYLEAVSWLPVGATLVVDLVRTPRTRTVGLLAAATAMSFLAGYPQTTLYVVYAWGSLLLALLIDARAGLRRWIAIGAAFGGALTLGAALAAVQLAPALELSRSGVRAAQDLGDKAMFPVSPSLTPALMVLRFGSIAGTPFAIGMVALALVPAALLAPRRRVLGWWAVGLALLSTIFGLGRFTPLFSLYLALPALRWFRDPDRIMVIADFGIALAAAFGLDAVLGPSPADAPRTRRVRVGAATVVAALGLAGAVRLAAQGWAPADALGTWAAFAAATLALLGAAVAWGSSRRDLVAVAFVAVATLEISLAPWHRFRLPYDAADVARYQLEAPTFRALAAEAGSGRVWRWGVGIVPEGALKLATRYHLRATNDYEPLNLQRQADFFSYLVDGTTARTRPPWLFPGDVATLEAPAGVAPPATRRRLLDLAAVRLFVVLGWQAAQADVKAFVDGAGLVARPMGQGYAAYRNPNALPRTFVTYGIRTAPATADEVLAAISRPDFDPMVESYVEGPPPFPASADPPPRGHPATFLRDDEQEVEIAATLERPGLLVLADSFYPGWSATVDGVRAPILATNYLFRGVPVPAGTHRVQFVYTPASVRLGALLSGAGLLVLASLVGYPRRGDGSPRQLAGLNGFAATAAPRPRPAA